VLLCARCRERSAAGASWVVRRRAAGRGVFDGRRGGGAGVGYGRGGGPTVRRAGRWRCNSIAPTTAESWQAVRPALRQSPVRPGGVVPRTACWRWVRASARAVRVSPARRPLRSLPLVNQKNQARFTSPRDWPLRTRPGAGARPSPRTRLAVLGFACLRRLCGPARLVRLVLPALLCWPRGALCALRGLCCLCGLPAACARLGPPAAAVRGSFLRVLLCGFCGLVRLGAACAAGVCPVRRPAGWSTNPHGRGCNRPRVPRALGGPRGGVRGSRTPPLQAVPEIIEFPRCWGRSTSNATSRSPHGATPRRGGAVASFLCRSGPLARAGRGRHPLGMACWWSFWATRRRLPPNARSPLP